MIIVEKMKKRIEEIEQEIKKYSPYPEKVRIVAATKYTDAAGVEKVVNAGVLDVGENRVQSMMEKIEKMGYGNLPVCIAKTQYSFSDNQKLLNAPEGFEMKVNEIRLSAGAGFVVVICGNIMTMPGLPKNPAAENIDVVKGKITGVF